MNEILFRLLPDHSAGPIDKAALVSFSLGKAFFTPLLRPES